MLVYPLSVDEDYTISFAWQEQLSVGCERDGLALLMSCFYNCIISAHLWIINIIDIADKAHLGGWPACV